jgi:hypothetical protein
MNLCLFSLNPNLELCLQLSKANLLYMSSSDTNLYTAQPTLNPSESASKVYAVKAKVLKYYPNGSLFGESTLQLGDLMVCQLPNVTS